jgi:hypothetical protein
MAVRYLTTSILTIAVLVPVVAGCTRDAPSPTAETVALTLVAGADHGGRPLTTDMTQGVTSSPVYAGDPDGTGKALITLNHGKGEVCWDVSVSDITLPATASHIHQAASDVRGPIVVGLVPPDAGGTSTGCTAGVDRDLIRDILKNPGSYYVNVHTSDYPPGAVRGQLPGS